MALKKSDLYGSLWRCCDELRGGMDASQYKDYILTLLFVKYVSDKAKAERDPLIVVPPHGSFDGMVAAKGKSDIGDQINKIIGELAGANKLEKVIDQADFNNEEKLGKGKEMQDRLSRLIGIFQTLDFQRSRAEGDDLLGDAYEYLMRHFATDSGKSKGQFYTPAEVSRVVAKIVGVDRGTLPSRTVYDPTCGSGSLLIKVADEAAHGISIYGQEKDVSTWALAKMNMILHGYEDHVLAKGDTLTSPQFVEDGHLKRFDFAVANPPFSYKSWSNGLEKKTEYGRFELGRPPKTNGDFAFLLHILASLKSTGKAAVILPHGVLFRSHAEAEIRKNVLDRGYIKGIIGLPQNLFYGTGIPASIIVLDKENAQARRGVFMIDASREYVKDGNKNRLRSRDVHKIVDVFNRRTEIDRYSRMVALDEIFDNDYSLNISRYIDSSDPEDIQDLHAHLHGGIPDSDLDALAAYWVAFPSLRDTLFRPNRLGYNDLAVGIADVRQTILDSPEFAKFAADVRARLDDWYRAHRPMLQAIDANTVPRDLIARIGGDLLARFRDLPLLDMYDVYEQLMVYWHDVMHDDVFVVMDEGWKDAALPRKPIDDKERKLVEAPDLVIGSGRKANKYKMDLIPPELVVFRFFPEDQARLDELIVRADESIREVEEFVEEHAGDDGPLVEAMVDGKITRASAAARLKEARHEGADEDEVDALHELIELLDAEAAAKKAAKDAKTNLDLMTYEKYYDLTLPDIKTLVLDNKWHAAIAQGVNEVVTALTFGLVNRIQELGERYAQTLGELRTQTADLETRVATHLAEMGIA